MTYAVSSSVAFMIKCNAICLSGYKYVNACRVTYIIKKVMFTLTINLDELHSTYIMLSLSHKVELVIDSHRWCTI